ncbi:MAG: hypothetical protein J6S86_03935 [Alphaproteobacteria bacterium]|nr:hypothetical protein [Alphaproteobacteria bacterium]
MKLVSCVVGILYGFAIISDANAMYFNKTDNYINSQYTGMSHSRIMRKLSQDIQYMKKNIIDEMGDFCQTMQSFESKVFTQTTGLCQHFWQLELLLEEQVARQINIEEEERNSKTYWKRYFEIMDDEQMSKQFDVAPLFCLCSNVKRTKELFYEKIANPLSYLRLSIKDFRVLFHNKMDKLAGCMYQLNRRVTLLKERCTLRRYRAYDKYMLELRSEVRQLYMVTDEYFYGSRNYINRLESVVEEQIVESQQNVDSLKVKIDESFAKLGQSLASQSDLLRFYAYQRSLLSEYVRDIDDMTYIENNSKMRMEISEFKKILYEDLSSLYQNVISLQSSIGGEFSYECNKFLK